MKELPISFSGSGPILAGSLRHPGHGPAPSVLLIHGTLEHDRDGNMVRHPDGRRLHPRPFFRHIANHLVKRGFAVFSWDKRGYGQSEAGLISLETLYEDARAALDTMCRQKRIVDTRRLAIIGQSAGVYTACQIARDDDRPRAFVLQGGLWSDYETMLRFNYERPLKYAALSEKNRKWVARHDPWGMTFGRHLSDIIKAGRAGKTHLDIEENGRSFRFPCDPLCYQPAYAPCRQFRHIRKPTLILHGGEDLNVPVSDAHEIEKELKKPGNPDVSKKIISAADHSFQTPPDDPDLRLRERLSLDCLKRPFNPLYFTALGDYLEETLTS